MLSVTMRKMTKLITVLFLLPHIVIAGDSTRLEFSPEGGFFEEKQQVTLSTLRGSVDIFYTLDGSEPTRGSRKYKNPITIHKTSVVRAASYLDGVKSEVQTNTFFIGREFTLPVISIATNPANFFSPEKGIYVKGCCADSVQPYYGANFWRGWERPINIEYYETDGTQAINQRAGVRIFGGFSKGLPMKSLAVISRKKYQKKYFKYQIFKEKPNIKKYKTFILRNSGGDFNNTHFRDALITQITRPTKVPIQAYQPTIVFINGEYWGIHNAREKLNEYYFKFNYGANEDSIDLMKHRNDLQLGTREKYKELKEFIANQDPSENKQIRALNKRMNIDNFLDHHIIQVYADNGDAGGNIRYWRPQGNDARWNWVLFDTDLGMGIGSKSAYKVNTLREMTTKSNEKWPNPAWSTFIIRSLLQNDSIKQIYINRLTNYLNTIYSEATVCATIDSMQRLIGEEMVFHRKKWGGRMSTWNKNVERLKIFASNRPHFIREHMKEVFNLSDTIKITVRKPKVGVKKLWFNTLKIDSTFAGTYFKYFPLSIKAKIESGYQLVGWRGSDKNGNDIEINPEGDLHIEPIVALRDTSDYWDKIIFSEVSFYQDSIHPEGDWVELRNISDKTIDIEGWEIRIDKALEKNEFMECKILPGEHITVAEDKVALGKFRPNLDLRRVIPGNNIKLKREGFQLLLLDKEDNIVDSLRIMNQDHQDTSRSLIDPEQNDHTMSSWESPSETTPNEINSTEKKRKIEKEENRQTIYIIGLSLFLLGIILLIVHRLRKKSKLVL